jgi:CPA1 family monovalent cation:H+ antiporter
MDSLLTTTIALLVVAILVALVARRLQLPYTVGLVVAGTALALSPIPPPAVLTHDLIFDVILPPLLFEAAININWNELRRDAPPILVLAVPGTLVAAAAVAFGLIHFLSWPIKPALLFGVLIAATDPVAVIAMFKDNNVRGRLRLLVESESLLNDGVTAVLFTFVLAWVQSSDEGAVSSIQVVLSLLLVVGGGVLAGVVCAVAAIALAGRTVDYLLESTLTTIAAYGSFLLAQRFHCSGVLATVTAGLLMGNLGILVAGEGEGEETRISRRGREFTLALWDFIAFVANSLVFLLIGLAVAGIAFERLGYRALAIIVALVLAGRALTVYPICLGFAWSRWRIGADVQHMLWWGGVRGALGLALALSLDPDLPMRDQIVIATFGVVLFSVVLQGLTMSVLLRATGIARRH